MAMSYVRQQDFDAEPLRLHGCALAAGINAMVDASDGDWAPGGDGTAFARILLGRSGATNAEFNTRGVTSRELFRALDATANDNDEWMPLRLRAFHGWLVSDMLDEMVKQKGCLILAVRNRVLVKAGKTRFKTFNGGHWGTITARMGSDVRWIAGEKSPITLSIRTLTDAADQFGDKTDVGLSDDSWGAGRGEAILVYPWRSWRQGYAGMKAQRDSAVRARDRARDELAECQAGNPVDPQCAARLADATDRIERAWIALGGTDGPAR